MAGHLIALIISLIALFCGALLLGRQLERKRLARELKPIEPSANKYIEREERIHNGNWFLPMYIFVISIIFLCASYTSLRSDTIDGYKKGRIVDRITYKYEVINGVKVLKDSTISYPKRRE